MRLLGIDKKSVVEDDWFASIHWGQSAEDAVLHRIFGEKREGFYVDVGAHHPKRFSNTHLFHRFLGWSGINIDANDSTIQMFKQERPADTSIIALVGEGNDEMVYTEFKGNARSTADAARTARIVKAGIEVVSTKKMIPRSLKSILEEHLQPGRVIDLLTIDIEGFDLQALRTNDWAKYQPNVICIEDFEFGMGKESQIATYLVPLGYVCISHCYDTSIYQKQREASR